ncbi:two-component system LytT family response regulator [Pedobacter sp. AK017]|uniref:LytR/AlgR family response regulator transcription factor n=1 Tax=Pedobacter sp. AK017 TaxID=2723073 RepID=UPI00161E503F|nr:LytTR family DNA-binding domain-containing protein [Pedobacter sp. AK017]MBB5438580.1 two-component system LytT family response regulator [Pedobacter sp. AK017]
MKIKSIIVDDETKSQSNLKQLLAEYCPAVEVIAEANSPTTALPLIAQHKPDLLFLDIEMGKLSGFDLLKILNGQQDFELIFVTAYDKYGIQAVKACALDYLLKPINILELSSAVDKAIKQIGPKKEDKRLRELVANIDRRDDEQKIAIPLADKIEFITIAKIIRLEAEGNYTHFYLIDNKHHLVCKTLKDYQELLDGHHFIRTHQSHLINFKKISAYVKTDGGYIAMEDGSQVPISRQKKDEVLSRIMKVKL